MMKSVRQNKAGGPLQVESVPVPEPGPGEVLVKMDFSPINPSDLASISGDYMVESWPFTPGFEGSGTVVKAGSGMIPFMRKGKRVACSPNPGGDGTWAEYMKTSAMRTVPLPKQIDMEQGSMMLVNPMTAMAFIQMAQKRGDAAMVNSAAASALGKMLIRLANNQSIPLISIVRREEQVEQLKELGAKYVLNSSVDSFDQELEELSRKLGATLLLDAVNGDLSRRMLQAAPIGSTLVTYARLSGKSLVADPSDLIRHEKTITGFQLGNWLKDKSIPFKLRFIGRVKKEMGGALTTTIREKFPPGEVNRAIDSYRENMSGGKILLIFK